MATTPLPDYVVQQLLDTGMITEDEIAEGAQGAGSAPGTSTTTAPAASEPTTTPPSDPSGFSSREEIARAANAAEAAGDRARAAELRSQWGNWRQQTSTPVAPAPGPLTADQIRDNAAKAEAEGRWIEAMSWKTQLLNIKGGQ